MSEAQADTRSRLLDATLEVLLEHGAAGATSRLIAARAGANLQAITYHFGSKDRLVTHALVHAVRRWTDPARQALVGVGEDPVGRLLASVEELSHGLDAARPYLSAYLEALALAPRDDEVRREITGVLDELRTEVAAAIGELRSRGLVAGWVDPEVMAALVVSAGDGFVVHSALEPDRYPVETVLGQVVQLLLAASTLPD